jgi:hypothetical protein
MTSWAPGPTASFQSGSFGAMDQGRNLWRPELARYAMHRERWAVSHRLSIGPYLANDSLICRFLME